MNATISVELQRRRAVVAPNCYGITKLGIDTTGPVPCHVLGLFQEVECNDCAYPVFVCELDDGRVIEANVQHVTFVDTEGGIICS